MPRTLAVFLLFTATSAAGALALSAPARACTVLCSGLTLQLVAPTVELLDGDTAAEPPVWDDAVVHTENMNGAPLELVHDDDAYALTPLASP